MVKMSKSMPQKEKTSSSKPADKQTAVEPCTEEFFTPSCVLEFDFKVEKTSLVLGWCEPISRYMCTILSAFLSQVKKECNWVDKHVVMPSPEESITMHVEGFLSVYTYPFTFSPLYPIIMDFCKKYEVTLGQIHHSFWRIVTLLWFFVGKVKGLPFTLDHLIRLYSPWLYRSGLINLRCWFTKAVFLITDEDMDRH